MLSQQGTITIVLRNKMVLIPSQVNT